MISYRKWKLMNESLGGPLGVTTVPTLGIHSSIPSIEEAKKKCNKMMDAGKLGDKDAETGDGEVVDAASVKDDPKVKNLDKKGGDDEEEGDDAGKKKLPPWLNKEAKSLPPWLQKYTKKGDKKKDDKHEKGESEEEEKAEHEKGEETKDEAKKGSCDHEGDSAGKVLPWLNKKKNHGETDAKTAHDKLNMAKQLQKEAQEILDSTYQSRIAEQIGVGRTKYQSGLEESVYHDGSKVYVNSELYRLVGFVDEFGRSKITPTSENLKKN